MSLILEIPIEVRLMLLFLLGVGVGGQLNRGIYRLAWNRRAIGPWSPPSDDVPRRRWTDRLPVLGWWGLRRERTVHGRGYWIRPMLLELGTGLAFSVLYWLEMEELVLWPSGTGVGTELLYAVHAQYLSHIILLSLMIVATFIDFDEQTIPDAITLTGTVLGLIVAIALPRSLLPTLVPTPVEPGVEASHCAHLVLTSSTVSAHWGGGLGGPGSWPPLLAGVWGLLLGLSGVWAWSFTMMHKTWTLRHGPANAVRYMVGSIIRHGTWRMPGLFALLLSLATVLTWSWQAAGGNEQRWQSLLTAIVGMCFGGGLILVVRTIGGHALRMEAMGFGDVTLMAMIGAFVGWQAALLVFFLAPVTAVAIALAQRILTGDQRIAFGPYLCFATVIVLVSWDSIWTRWAYPMFSLGWFVPGVLACCLVLMGGLLWMWRIVRDAIFGWT